MRTFKSLTRASLLEGGVSSFDPTSFSCCSSSPGIFGEVQRRPLAEKLKLSEGAELEPLSYMESWGYNLQRTEGFQFFFFFFFFVSFGGRDSEERFRTIKLEMSSKCEWNLLFKCLIFISGFLLSCPLRFYYSYCSNDKFVIFIWPKHYFRPKFSYVCTVTPMRFKKFKIPPMIKL